MGVNVQTKDLRKIYNTPPPFAAAGAAMFAGRAKGPKTKGAKKQKTEILALDGVSLEVHAGEIFGLLGPNGAGKTTTVGILTTRVKPTAGEAWIGPHDVWRDQVSAKWLIGVVQQRPNLDFSLTAREILLFHAAYFGVPAAERARRSSELLERFQLTDRADEIVRGYSGGMMQRLAIARAMMHDPEVLFLDEPSTGLDPQTRLLLWEIIREYNRLGKTIMITTHNMEEADSLSQRIAIIDHGKVIALGTPAELKQSIPGGYVVRVKFSAPVNGLADCLRALPGVNEVKPSGANVDIYADRGGPLVGPIVACATAAGIDVSDVHIAEPSLENLFLHHTGRSLRQ